VLSKEGVLQQARQLTLGEQLPLAVQAHTWRRLRFCRLLLLLLRCRGHWRLLVTLLLLLL
jgi:hypothetical protein